MKQLSIALMMAATLIMGLPVDTAANTVRTWPLTVKDTTIAVTGDWDYTLKSATPFGDNGIVDIVNTEHAVLIIEKVKPSETLKLLSHVKINGKAAKDGSNCQVKLYNRGTIILPYGDSTKPLTCYSEPNFEGNSYTNYTLGHSGGYMKTLTATALKNKIRSFKLKRGYMVTFATQDGGRGYSRCFIAADKDVEMGELPLVLDQKISSYRIFKWYDAGKKQLANDMRAEVLAALNVQSSYDWGQGNSSMLPDYEWVPNHIYEDWPSSATIGGTSQSPHTKNNNEPRNSADDHPQDLQTILDNWENMMRTGMRLCSPASWDGSDYDNATGFLAQFLDSIDARGWRCDIIDLHCYWPESKFNNLHNWSDKYRRPIWISEWCWGASWNKNGAFANGVTQAQVKTALQNICTKLNGWDYVERYYYWNGEASISRLYDNGKLTPAGEYYAGMTTGLAYNGKYDFVPRNPRQYGPSKYKETTEDGKITKISWYDSNGEYNRLMVVEKKGADGWEPVFTPQQRETAFTYTYTPEQPEEGVKYRVHIVDLNGKAYYTGDDKTPSAIRLPNTTKAMLDGLYTLDGRQVYNASRPGIYIKVSAGRTSKYIVK
jgi:Glycosyl hydrolase catalytic core.